MRQKRICQSVNEFGRYDVEHRTDFNNEQDDIHLSNEVNYHIITKYLKVLKRTLR